MVIEGETIDILSEQSTFPIAVLSPYYSNQNNRRTIGSYNDIASFSEIDSGRITEDEFLGN